MIEAHDMWVIVEMRDVVEIRGVVIPDVAQESQSVHLYSVGPRCPEQLRAYPKGTRVVLFGQTPLTTIPGFKKLYGVLHSGIMGFIVDEDKKLGTERFAASGLVAVPAGEPGLPPGHKVEDKKEEKA